MAMQRARRLRLFLISALFLAWGMSATDAAEPAEATAPAALAATRDAAPAPWCLERCTPGKLIFLPCMAVGAKNMAVCRDREIAHCMDACSRRPCQDCPR